MLAVSLYHTSSQLHEHQITIQVMEVTNSESMESGNTYF